MSEKDLVQFTRDLSHDLEILRKIRHSYEEEAQMVAEIEKARDEILEALDEDSPHSVAIAKRLFMNFFGLRE